MDVPGPSLILFRKPQPDDPFEAAFSRAGWEVRSIPVLAFTFTNQEILDAKLAAPEGYAGVIVTSPRAAESLRERFSEAPMRLEVWRDKHLVCIGNRTAACLAEGGLTPLVADRAVGEKVAEAVIALETEGRWLFICGNLRREELPARLEDAGVLFEELQVYETHLQPQIDLSGIEKPDWTAFFSPSGVRALREVWPDNWTGVKRAAIGKTTAKAMSDAGWQPDAVADKPDPLSLLSAVLEQR